MPLVSARVLKLWSLYLVLGVLIVLSEGVLSPNEVRDGPKVSERPFRGFPTSRWPFPPRPSTFQRLGAPLGLAFPG